MLFSSTRKFLNRKRRKLIYRIVKYCSVTVNGTITFKGLIKIQNKPKITKLKINLNKKHEGLRGVTFLHLSDLHLGFYSKESYLCSIIEISEKLNPHFIFVTGDLTDYSIKYISTFSRFIKRCHFQKGLYVTLGNHDVYVGASSVERILKDYGITVLRDRTINLEDLPLSITGLNDPGLGGAEEEMKNSIARALHDKNPDYFSLILAHRPDYFNFIAEQQIDLMLAGHTHGGQFSFSFDGIGLANLIYSYPKGYFNKNGKQLYVSRGLATVGLPFRINTPEEIVFIELV